MPLSGGLQLMPVNSIAFVDVGWFRKSAARALRREEAVIGLRPDGLLRHLQQLPNGQRLLRQYLYEGRFGEDEPNQREAQAPWLTYLAEHARTTLRLGTAITRGKVVAQKGVDGRLVLDMLTLARRGAYGTAYLVTGDADFVPVVREVQRDGIQLILVTIEDGGGVSNELRQTADLVSPISPGVLAGMVELPPGTVAVASR